MTNDHACQWDPIDKWVGRYRCSICKIIAYKSIVRPSELNAKVGVQIIPYRCCKCHKPAHIFDKRKGKGYCDACSEGS